MSALVIGLLILAVVGLGFLAVEAHRKDMAALNAKWQAKYDEDHGDWADEHERLGYENIALTRKVASKESRLRDELRNHAVTQGDLEWQTLRNTVLQAELDRHFLMPTIDGLRAAHRDLAPVVPIGGRG